MYKAHFRIRELPFSITPDTGYFFSFRSYQEALNTLLVAARNGEGFIKITGEVGTGKTLLCRKFMSLLDTDFVTAYIPNPLLEARSLMLALADELGIQEDRQLDQHQLIKAINLKLLHIARTGKRTLLCIDEAQALPLETLEALRLLSNLETEKRKLLQIVLFAQPELDRKLAQKEIRQLTQRISFHYQLQTLSSQEIKIYINHRLRVAGYQGPALFSTAALFVLSRCSGGVPRMLNILAHKAMMLSFGEGRQAVTARHILLAAKDTFALTRINSYLRLTALASTASLLVLATMAYLHFL
ncbi:ExeA family protein [Undibacterium parvum]|uniref:AAA family ATPase n=1 Tax=Undibacterium parvum TaxID=401471 RepID=A0A3Q9BQN5_9BURK|nr:AAA family ATPase [Undibacterium parvum]AZP11497.1 AAA family ATPase [Undibacterium parvum]